MRSLYGVRAIEAAWLHTKVRMNFATPEEEAQLGRICNSIPTLCLRQDGVHENGGARSERHGGAGNLAMALTRLGNMKRR